MKAFVFAMLALLILIVGAAVFLDYISASAAEIASGFDALHAAILAEDWPEARRLYTESERRWRQAQRIWPMLINHDDMRDVEISFIELAVILGQENRDQAEKELATLRYYLNHVPATEEMNWQNVF